MVKFKFDNETLLLMQEGDTKEYPSEWISVSELGALDDYGEQRSFWIDYLSMQPWFPKSSLYFLGKIIQDKCPENKIDWFKTFYDIEFNCLVIKRKKEILAQRTCQSKFGARNYSEVINTYLIALQEVRSTVPVGKIVAMVQKNAAKYKVSVT